ncbi:MAG: serine hydrolase [Marivirga sp.]|nr:serine hydrolase [Marivirga sp.]
MYSRFYLFLLVGFTSCSKPAPTSKEVAKTFTGNYLAPSFTDTGRLEKIRLAIPAVEKIFKTYSAKNHFPGLAFGIVADNKLIHSGGFGSINLKTKVPATPKSIFRIASMTKSFTAMAVLKLRDDGRLNLNDPVSKYIPEMGKITYLTGDSPDITIQNLLTMSAGFPEDNPWGDRQLADSEEELLTLIRDDISFANTPSKEFEYSNLGYGMLGIIINKVSGKPYQQYITENILKPLGMNNTYWEYEKVPAGLLALGYRWEDGQWKEEQLLHDGIFGAMGGLITSIEDFSNYVNLHLSAWPPRNGEETGPVKRSSLREMHKPWQFRQLTSDSKSPDGTLCPAAAGYGYGLGWRKDCMGTERVSHSGGLPGFGSEYRFYPEYGIGIISFANLTYASAGAVNTRALDTLLMISGIKPRELPISDHLKQKKDQVMQLIKSWDEKLGNEILAENFYLDLSREAWIKKSEQILKELGTVTSVSPLIPENQLRGTFTLYGEKSNVKIFFTLTPEHSPKIQELQMNVVR